MRREPNRCGPAIALWLTATTLADAGELTFHRFPWWGPNTFSYADEMMEVEFRVRKLTQIVSTGRVLVRRDGELVPLIASITPYSAPGNSKLDERLHIEPKGRHFEVWNHYRPPEHLAERCASARGGVRLGPSAGEIGVWVTWSGAAKRASHINACTIDLPADTGAFTLRTLPSGTAIEQAPHTSRACAAWVASTERGAVAALLDREGTTSALLAVLPDVVVSSKGKARRVLFRFLKPVTGEEEATARWRMYVSGDLDAGAVFWELASRHAARPKERR